jgi:hypothetical protein
MSKFLPKTIKEWNAWPQSIKEPENIETYRVGLPNPAGVDFRVARRRRKALKMKHFKIALNTKQRCLMNTTNFKNH